MKILSNLKLMRKEWYSAFYSLDTHQLDYLETDWFFSTNGSKLIHKPHQLRKLNVLKNSNPLAYSQIRREEKELEVRELGNIASVSGVAILTDSQGVRTINFIECWIKINDAWKLQFQTFEEELCD
ncbi:MULTISPECIES: nuclear transport factor 2 family protein [Pseudomonas]|uniref:nuclear transport factor 2 family protein n=1 Tax=Pseudomonas TaxID=286 RepID=UPI001981360E|nr:MULTISPECIES: nuclear transport factor 2 family protein [unclassified Pseudomonas]